MLIDVSQPPTAEDRKLLDEWGDGIIVAHKCDLEDVWGAEKPQSAFAVSSVTSEGLEDLSSEILRRLVPVVPEPTTPVPVTRRQIEVLKAI